MHDLSPLSPIEFRRSLWARLPQAVKVVAGILTALGVIGSGAAAVNAYSPVQLAAVKEWETKTEAQVAHEKLQQQIDAMQTSLPASVADAVVKAMDERRAGRRGR